MHDFILLLSLQKPDFRELRNEHGDSDPKPLFQEKSVAEEFKVKGRLSCKGGDYLKAGEKPLEIEPDDKSLREVT